MAYKAPTTKVQPKADLLTPRVQSLVGEILTEASREDSNPLSDYIDMLQTSPIVGPCIELKILLALGMLGEYSHEEDSHQEHIRKCFELMRGSLKLSVAELLCVGPLGYACAEWAPIQIDGKWMLDAIQILDPRKYRFRGKRGAIEDLLYAGDTGDITVPYDRVIHLINQPYLAFGSPYGVAECKRALSAYKAWKITIAAALIAAKRRGEPILVGYAEPDQQVQIGTEDDGTPIYLTAPQALLQSLQELENNSVAATSIANRIELLEAAEGTLILDVLKVLERYQLMAFLIPESILSATGVGDSNLNTGHRTILHLTVEATIEQIKERLIEDVVRPLLIWEFGENVENFGSFPSPKQHEEGGIDTLNAIIDAVFNGAFSAADLDVVNRMRELAGLPAVTEIAEQLDAAPTDAPIDPAADPAADPATDGGDDSGVDAGAIQFAARRPRKGRKGGKGKKNCNKGINCGGTCISAKKNCRKDNPSEKVKAKAKSIGGGGGGGGAVTLDENLHPLAKIGASIIGDDLRKLDAVIGQSSKIADLEKAFDDAFDRDPAKAFDSPEWKALSEAKSKESGEAIKLMAEIRSKLNQMDRSEAEKLAGQAKILKSVGKIEQEDEIRGRLADFYQLSGGRGSKSLKKIKFDDDRAYAHEDGSLNIGRSASPSEARAVFFHEMGHHVEFQSTKTRDKLNDWVDKRSEGAKPVPLNSLVKNAAFDDDEFARPGKFISPYVGKTYSDGATEVLSMGVERFYSPQSMLDFYKSDREHFLLTIGALND